MGAPQFISLMEQTVQKLLQDVQNQLSDLEKRKKEFEVQMKQREEEFENRKQRELQNIMENAEKVLAEKASNLTEREQKLINQENFIRDQQLKNSKIIKLNVGGEKFTTTLTTLTADKDSMLAAMFSGRFTLEKDEDGCYFIDRNGKRFSYILDYLRDGSIAGNISKDMLQELAKEASYYQLTSLTQAIKQSLGDPHNPQKSSADEEYIVWSNSFLNIYGKVDTKAQQTAELEISALIKKGYVPIKTIFISQHGKVIIFKKQI